MECQLGLLDPGNREKAGRPHAAFQPADRARGRGQNEKG